MSAFVSADIDKIARFEEKSREVIIEFNAIKDRFNSINSTLLSKWKGEGADAYKQETDHILEKIGGVADVLDGLNNGAVAAVKENYTALDEELGEFNKNPGGDEGAGKQRGQRPQV